MKRLSFKEFMKRDDNKVVLESLDEKYGKLFESEDDKKEEPEEDKEITDKDIEKEAKSKTKGDEELEKEVEKEAEEESKKKKIKKVLIGVVDERNHDGEVSKGVVLETDLPEKKIEDLETREDVIASGNNAKKLKTIAEIAKYIKKLEGTIIYWFDFESDHEGDVAWKKVKV